MSSAEIDAHVLRTTNSNRAREPSSNRVSEATSIIGRAPSLAMLASANNSTTKELQSVTHVVGLKCHPCGRPYSPVGRGSG